MPDYLLQSIRGVTNDSVILFHTPSDFARESLFYIESCGHFICDETYSCIRRDMDNIQLLHVSNGHGYLVYAGKVYTIKAGDCFLIDCNVPHKYYSDTDWQTWWCHFRGLSTQMLFQQIWKNTKCPVFTLNAKSQIPYLLESIIETKLHNVDSPEMQISCLIHQLLYDAYMCSKYHTQEASAVRIAVEYIHEHFEQKITLQDLCSVTFLSKYYLCRIFKREIGYSPYQYITLLRINTAKRLLISTPKSIQEIADDTGFTSESNFIRTFYNHMKFTPTQFRHMNM